MTNRAAAQPDPLTASAVAADQIVLAGPGVRCCSFLLDLAVMASPVLPLATVGAILGVAEVVYLVVPVAFVAVWIWMQIWQGFSGTSFGKSVLGLRLIREADRRAPGFPAAAGRSLVFAATGGLAALPAIAGPPRGGMHDRVSGLVLIDIAVGANPLGPRQQTGLRRTVDRGLKSVHSPVPLGATGQR
ncbi:MAG: RDD family protein [Mycobacterium sp.]